MSLTLLFGLLTLTPIVMALALVGLGLARRASVGLALGLTLVGVIVPIIGLALLAPEVSAGLPLEIGLWGGASTWLALFGRADALGVYAAIGVAVIVGPMLAWLAWQTAPLDAAEEASLDETDAADTDANIAGAATPTQGLGRWQWTGVALALTLESLALWVCFSENILLLGIVWVALVVCGWALGELGSETAILDWRGLGLMVAGPIIWLVTMLLVAAPLGDRRLLDLTGAGRIPNGHVIVLSLAIILAAGAYPALAWLRKRVSIATPAGLAAVSLAIMPAALLIGARTFSIGAATANSWATFTIGKPPITVGIILTLFGALSVAAAGLLALGHRDPRNLLGTLTLAQAGWGLVGLGVGAPLSLLGVTLLLATSVIGLGAVIAALVAGGAITSDLEPESAGPRVLGEPSRAPLLFAWLIGAASLVGAPLFAGFAPLQLITAQALTGPRLSIPLIGLAWFGVALLAIALVRATAPAYTAPLIAVYVTDPDATDVEEVEPVVAPELRLEELPAVALGIVALLIGIVPGVALWLATGAAGSTLQAGALNGLAAAGPSGYAAGVGQWYATAPVIFVAIGALVLAYIRSRMPRDTQPQALAGQTADHMSATAEPDILADEGEEPAELVALPEPQDAWGDVHPAFRAGWLTPGAAWLGLNHEDDVDGDEHEDEHEEDTLTTDTNNDVTNSAPTATSSATPRGNGNQA